MHRKFIALILSAATAVATLSPAPARANEDIGKVLAGLAALAIIGAALNDARDDTPPVVHRHRYPYPTGPVVRPHDRRPAPVSPRPLPSGVTRYDLPQQCLRKFDAYRGNTRLFGLNCLQRNYRHVNQLPYACRVQFGNGRQGHVGYEPVCLRERGYRVARN